MGAGASTPAKLKAKFIAIEARIKLHAERERNAELAASSSASARVLARQFDLAAVDETSALRARNKTAGKAAVAAKPTSTASTPEGSNPGGSASNGGSTATTGATGPGSPG